MKIGIGNDHHGLIEKKVIIDYLTSQGIEYIDFGTNDSSTKSDYVDYAVEICNAINEKNIEKGILICKTGIGMSIVANKIKGINCARVLTEEDAYLSRLHNNVNVIAIPENVENEELINIVKTFINTAFSNEERHIRRINKINNL